MKKIISKILVCALLALLSVSTISMYIPVSAASPINSGSLVSPASYDRLNFSFTGSCGISRNMAGMFMDVTVRGTADNGNNETIFLDVFINNRNVTKSYTFLTDGQDHTYKNIYLGLSGGSNVYFEFTGANPEIKINMHLEMAS